MNLRRPLFAAIAAAILFAAYVADRRRVERELYREAQGLQVLFNDPSSAAEIEFQNEYGRVLLRRAGTEWRIAEPRDLPANQSAIASYLENLRGAKRQAQFRPDDVAKYGLGAPSRTVRVAWDEKGQRTERTLEFGRAPDNFANVYARIRGEEEIFTASEWLYRQSGKYLDAIRDLTILPAGIPKATKLRIENRREKFSIERTADTSTNWLLLLPETKPIPADRAAIDRLVQNLASGKFLSVVDKPTSSTASLGLDDPLARLYADGELLASVGKPVDGREQFYVSTKEAPVGIAPAHLFADLFRPGIEWGSKNFVWASPRDIQQVEGGGANSRFTLLRTPAGWVSPEMPGVPIRADRVESFLENAAALSASRLVAAKLAEDRFIDYGIVDASYGVQVTDADGRVQGFRLGRTDSKEGISYALRTQDSSLWAIHFTQQANVFRARSDFEDRRLIADLGRTHRVEMELQGKLLLMERTPAAWRITFPDAKPALVAPDLVASFLDTLEGLESESEMLATVSIPPIVTFRFFEDGAKQPFATLDVLTRSKDSGNALLRLDKKLYEVASSKFDAFDKEWATILVRMKQAAEKAQ